MADALQDGLRQRLEGQLRTLEELENVLDVLYKQFLELRTTPKDWKGELKSMQEWVHSDES